MCLILWSKIEPTETGAQLVLRGCSQRHPCPGCQVHDPHVGILCGVERVLELLEPYERIEITGGEPFAQIGALNQLVQYLDKAGKQVALRSCLYTLEDLQEMVDVDPYIASILYHATSLIARDGTVTDLRQPGLGLPAPEPALATATIAT